MDISNVLTKEARDQGLTLNEPDDHILELLFTSIVIAKFSQTGVQVENILNEVQEVSKK
ncbi:unnamed protein product [marine sediment metagenome]|uniref:Uncharacterized protein n=1 Tax=marine sediment metagenome TaxID=412755 RepID=X1HW83_9ZZZZ